LVGCHLQSVFDVFQLSCGVMPLSNNAGTSQDELFATKALVDELIASRQYSAAVELAKRGEQPFASMNSLLKQWKAGIERCGALFSLVDAIEFHAFAPLEALPCV
jgi:hypothetical protein